MDCGSVKGAVRVFDSGDDSDILVISGDALGL